MKGLQHRRAWNSYKQDNRQICARSRQRAALIVLEHGWDHASHWVMVKATLAEFGVGRRACSWTQITAKVRALCALKMALTAIDPALSDDRPDCRGAYALALRCSQVTMRKRHRPLRTLCTKPKAAIMLMIQTDRKTVQAQKRRSATAPPFDRISLYLNEMHGGHDKD